MFLKNCVFFLNPLQPIPRLDRCNFQSNLKILGEKTQFPVDHHVKDFYSQALPSLRPSLSFTLSSHLQSLYGLFRESIISLDYFARIHVLFLDFFDQIEPCQCIPPYIHVYVYVRAGNLYSVFKAEKIFRGGKL